MAGMRGLLCGAVLCARALAAGPDYFPLHPGNQWVYRCTGMCAEPLAVVGVTRADYVAGRWYSVFEGFGRGEALLRQDGDGTVWALDRATGQESRWYAFSTPVGQSYGTSVDPCSPTAAVASRNHRHEGPAGSFPETLRVVYAPGSCADAGLTEEIFYRWTGLLRRSETTIGGLRTYDLIYARTAGATVISQPELHFSLTLDKPVYTADLMPPVDPAAGIPRLTARLTLRNTSDKPVLLDFSSGQRYEIEIKDEKGAVVYRWSEGRGFPLALGQETIGPGEKNYVAVIPLAVKSGRPFPQGRYVAGAWITNSGPQRFRASMGFEVRHVY
ncbi:MAG: hypothetical protein IT159_06240 [Bryobacterales bacterium]|nr:hypothetical protein [Bryobacterales bacterium]